MPNSGKNETARTYDLVEENQFLYVKVVKARDLPGKHDPYVEVKIWNYKGITKHLEMEENQYPVWNSVFAFNKETSQSNLIEVTVKNKDELLGKVVFDVKDVPLRVPPDSPLPPQWYKLEDEKGGKSSIPGEIMLAIWMGTQADVAYPVAWRCDAHSVSQQDLAHTLPKVYFSPKLYYLRICVIEAMDLISSEKGQAPVASVKIQVGNQDRATRPVETRANRTMWDEELLFIVAEPFNEEYIIISVDDKGTPIGRLLLPITEVPLRLEGAKLSDARWFDLQTPSDVEKQGEKKKKFKFSSKIHLLLCIDAGYHVQDESSHFRCDFQPSSKHLRAPRIGIVELGFVKARILQPTENRNGRNINAYCVAKYGSKWIRTRTLVDTETPDWNEQYTWEVYDTCTVITVGVFDNCSIDKSKKEPKDQKIGKVRIRHSTLDNNRVYHYRYPLLILRANGLMRLGKLHLAIRLTYESWVNMVKQYGRSLFPKMHYVQHLSGFQMDLLHHQAMQIVAARLSKENPPLRKETVEYMLDIDYGKFSLRRIKANFGRLELLLSKISTLHGWFDDTCQWKNPFQTILLHVILLILVHYPDLILPTIFLYLFTICLWNYRFRPRQPLHFDPLFSLVDNADEDELEEELDTFPTSESIDIVRLRYDRMRSVAGHFLIVVEDLATMLERAHSILSWRDPRETAICVMLALLCVVFLLSIPIKVVSQVIIFYSLQHPWLRSKLPSRLRSKLPSVAVNLFNRAPAKSDMLL